MQRQRFFRTHMRLSVDVEHRAHAIGGKYSGPSLHRAEGA